MTRRNGRIRAIRRDNTSGVPGVCRNTDLNKWQNLRDQDPGSPLRAAFDAKRRREARKAAEAAPSIPTTDEFGKPMTTARDIVESAFRRSGWSRVMSL